MCSVPLGGALVAASLAALALAALLLARARAREAFSSPGVPEYRRKRTLCFSCEREIAEDALKYLGQPSACFSCERDLAARGRSPFLASGAMS